MRIDAAIAGVLLASSVCVASPPAWTIVSQERRCWTKTTSGFDGARVSDTEEIFAGFGQFDADARSSGDMVDTVGMREIDAGGRAYQNSLLTTRAFTISAISSGSAYVEGVGGFAETDAWTQLTVQFDLDSDAAIRLDGFLDGGGFGQCAFQLSGPAGFVPIDILIQDSYHEFFADVLDAPQGEYTLYVDAFSDTTSSGVFDDQYADFEIEVALVECGSQQEPLVLEDVAYALTESPAWLERNLDLDGIEPWSHAGDSTYVFGNGVAADPTTGKLHVMRTYTDFSGTRQWISQVNGANGHQVSDTTVTVQIPQPPVGTGLFDIAFRPDGVLFGILGNGAPAAICTVDPGTGGVSFVGDYGVYDPVYGAAIAFDPATGLLYLAAGASLFAIDLGTGSSTPVPVNGSPIIRSLAFHSDTGALFAGLEDGTTVEIDLATGEVYSLSFAGSLGWPVVGLTFLQGLVLDGDLNECIPAFGSQGDSDGDGDIDLDDYSSLFACATGPGRGIGSAGCISADVDEDGDIDLFDFYKLQLLSMN